MQFVCTSHSPQVIGEVRREEIQVLSEDDTEEAKQPPQSKGMDSNWILEVVQRADERDPDVKKRITVLFEKLARKEEELKLATSVVAASSFTKETLGRARKASGP